MLHPCQALDRSSSQGKSFLPNKASCIGAFKGAHYPGLPKKANPSLISNSTNATQVPRSHQASSFGVGPNFESVSRWPPCTCVYITGDSPDGRKGTALWTVPDHRPPRRRRHGGGVSRPRYTPWPLSRGQNPSKRLGSSRRPPSSVHSGSARRLRAQPPEHRHHLRDRDIRWHRRDRDGARSRQEPA